ncbi:uncharacterized GPI-anchored protein At5g19250-like [Zingiber officinale]|uniref:uncharacterized GPI-anchored protein At5g19250-like n=1 Tax=Zingiber officinale TaxID=94328 RepID=UPI001C4DB483|nr:uncharacterized GPI-anchored protein At5g19250-like [Zingiber officinale]
MGFNISLFSFLLLLPFLLHPARSDDTSTQLLVGLNKYRGSLNLSSLADNSNAACLAEQVALAFKGQDCSNSTGSYTVPGQEQQFPNFPNYLSTCHLNATVTQDGSIMPVCVQGLAHDLVLSNYTDTQYNQYLNDSSFVGIGIADEDDWVVAILTTDTPTGNYAPAADTTSGSASLVVNHLNVPLLLLGFALFLIN